MAKIFLHNDPEFKDLINQVSEEMSISPFLVEKDYWIMHALYGLKSQGFDFELKGGTSLSKGYKIIHRFSEDIDLKILPPDSMKVMAGKNHSKDIHIESRKNFFNWLADEIKINGLKATREYEFDDEKFRNAGINLHFNSVTETITGVKPAVLLETGFDDTTPNRPITISSWVVDKAQEIGLENYIDNRAIEVKCYIPEFTFVEKLQAIATKHRKYKESGRIEKNFMRHYYDLYCLLELKEIKEFIEKPDYIKRKNERFPQKDSPDKLNTNPAFSLSDKADFDLFNSSYQVTSGLYFLGQPDFNLVMKKIREIQKQL
jgi:predicted nucleotidyltransferase component of viral defense system